MLASDPAFKKRTEPRRIADRTNIFIISLRKESSNATCDWILHTAAVNCCKKSVVGCLVSSASTSRFETSHSKTHTKKKIYYLTGRSFRLFLQSGNRRSANIGLQEFYHPPTSLDESIPGLLVLWRYPLQILTDVVINFLRDFLQSSQAIFRNTTPSSVLYNYPSFSVDVVWTLTLIRRGIWIHKKCKQV
jgi:hypothetical protein